MLCFSGLPPPTSKLVGKVFDFPSLGELCWVAHSGCLKSDGSRLLLKKLTFWKQLCQVFSREEQERTKREEIGNWLHREQQGTGRGGTVSRDRCP